jgi:hypothetical protein
MYRLGGAKKENVMHKPGMQENRKIVLYLLPINKGGTMTKAEAKELERAIKRDLNTSTAIREALGPRVDIWVEQQRTTKANRPPTFYVALRRQNVLAGITTYTEWREYLAATVGIPLPVMEEDATSDASLPVIEEDATGDTALPMVGEDATR